MKYDFYEHIKNNLLSKPVAISLSRLLKDCNIKPSEVEITSERGPRRLLKIQNGNCFVDFRDDFYEPDFLLNINNYKLHYSEFANHGKYYGSFVNSTGLYIFSGDSDWKAENIKVDIAYYDTEALEEMKKLKGKVSDIKDLTQKDFNTYAILPDDKYEVIIPKKQQANGTLNTLLNLTTQEEFFKRDTLKRKLEK